jgi:hypothetical protein
VNTRVIHSVALEDNPAAAEKPTWFAEVGAPIAPDKVVALTNVSVVPDGTEERKVLILPSSTVKFGGVVELMSRKFSSRSPSE